jgi:hypothetical protein
VAYYERAGAHELEETSVETRIEGRRARVPTLVSTNKNGASLALMPWPADGKETSWTHGVVKTKEDLSAALVRAIGGARERRGSQGDTDVRGAGAGALVYHISPAIRKLEAGEEVRIDCALVAAPSRALFDEAASSALVTYLGDGENRYVPPPLAMTPRLIWGRYRAAPDEHEAIAFRLEPMGEESVGAERISSFSGVDPFALEKRTDPSSNATWTLRGDIASDMLNSKDRMTLKGRLDNGEFFELILRPEEESLSGMSDELFWKMPGKLEQELVSGSPNPFRNSTTVFYEIPSEITLEDGSTLRSMGPYETSVKVYSVSGRLVSTLVEGRLFPGLYSIDWPAVDERGNAVASGVYYVKLQVEKKFITRRLILLK